MKSLDSEEYLKIRMVKLMIVGVFVSMSLIVFGTILYLIEYGNNKLDTTNFNYKMEKFTVLFDKIYHLDPVSIIQLGIFTLFFLQIFRVLLVLRYFIKIRDKLFIFLTMFISFVLLCSWYNV